MTDVTGPLDPCWRPCHREVRRLTLGGCAEGLIIHSLSHVGEVTEDYVMSITDLLRRARLRSSVPARIEASFERTGQLDQDAHRVGQARRIARAWLHLWGAADLVDPAVSALSEVVTNAFVHGQGETVTVRLTLTDVRLLIEVSGGGPWAPKRHSREPLEESGRGLWIVDSISDCWGISEGGLVWCVIRRNTSGLPGLR
ncbi:ATP-binding protein [Streptomyces sp. NPDC056485]|uniref:ATP-binding protein n=1 Tax=Streptomyces sp. NPDC056485 TaxID=3345834 RepID=UPI0036C66BBB